MGTKRGPGTQPAACADDAQEGLACSQQHVWMMQKRAWHSPKGVWYRENYGAVLMKQGWIGFKEAVLVKQQLLQSLFSRPLVQQHVARQAADRGASARTSSWWQGGAAWEKGACTHPAARGTESR